MEAEVVLEGRGHRVQHLDIRAGTEEPVTSPDDQDDMDIIIHPRLQDRSIEVLHHLIGIGVSRWVIECEECYPILDLIEIGRASCRERVEVRERGCAYT